MRDKDIYAFDITDEPGNPFNLTDGELRMSTVCHERAFKPTNKNIRYIKKSIEKYPHIPKLYNYLAVALSFQGDFAEAGRVNDKLFELFPDYLFGRTHLAVNALKQDKIDRAVQLLGGMDGMHLHKLYPDRDTFHTSEVMAYYVAVGIYQTKVDDIDAAQSTLEFLLGTFNEDDDRLSVLVDNILFKIAERRKRTIEEEQKYVREVDSAQTYFLEPTYEPPILHHSDLEAFYTYNTDDIPPNIVEAISVLPYESLKTDLRLIILDSIRRFDHFAFETEWDESTHSFLYHALNFIGALKIDDLLEDVLNLFRQGEFFFDFWFDEIFEELMLPTLFSMAKNRFSVLLSFVNEPLIYYSAKVMVSEVVLQVALHDPKRREEAIQWYRDVIAFYEDHEQDDQIFDTAFLSFMISDVVDMRATQFVDVIKSFYDRRWLMIDMVGSEEELIREIHLPSNPGDINPQPESIFEYYNGAYRDRKQPSNIDYDDLINKINSKASVLLQGRMLDYIIGDDLGADSFDLDNDDELLNNQNRFESEEPYVRSEQKIGRNDPCPCGSGKKYKKCCLGSASESPLRLVRNN